MKTKEFKSKNGITLIALIVTIIIILIISGITIATITGHNGIINNATSAKKSSERSSILEQINIAIKSGVSTKTLKINETKFKQALTNTFGTEGQGYTITGDSEKNWIVTVNSISFVINEDAKIWNLEDISTLINSKDTTKNEKTNKTIAVRDSSTSKEIFFLPENFKLASDSATKVDEGIVVEDEEGNQFVWVPVPEPVANSEEEGNIQKSMAVKLENGNYRGLLYDFDESSSSVRNGCTTTSSLYREPSLVSDYDNTTDEFKVGDLQGEYNAMILSVLNFKGFFVGRYETGYENINGNIKIVSKNASSNENVTTADASKSVTKYWYGLYNAQKNFSKSGTVISSMIWGSQYDAMMNWMCKSGIMVNEESDENTNKSVITGNNTNDVINKIYDLNGCHIEWSMEAKGTNNRTRRGGNSVSVRAPANRNAFTPDGDNWYRGSRITLYIAN